ncbi:MAG: hypothetical protein U0T77_07760 [Chitinophagales bacterium]
MNEMNGNNKKRDASMIRSLSGTRRFRRIGNLLEDFEKGLVKEEAYGDSFAGAKKILTVEKWRWLCVFCINQHLLQIKFITQNFKYQIYHNYCQFFVVRS